MKKLILTVLLLILPFTMIACSPVQNNIQTNTPLDEQNITAEDIEEGKQVIQDYAEALNSGYLAGAGIDVFENEPPIDPAHPLLNCRNTIVTPHIAFASAESMKLRAEIVFENLKKWMEGDQINKII